MINLYTLGITNSINTATSGKNTLAKTPATPSVSHDKIHVATKENSKQVSFGEPILASLGAIYGWTLLGIHPIEAIVTFFPVLAAQRIVSIALFDTKASYLEAAFKHIAKKAQQLEVLPNTDKKVIKEFYEAAKYMAKSQKYKWATDPRSLAGQTLFVQTFDDTKLAKKNLYLLHTLLKKDFANKYPSVIKELDKYFTTGAYSPKNLEPPKIPDLKFFENLKLSDLKFSKFAKLPKFKPEKPVSVKVKAVKATKAGKPVKPVEIKATQPASQEIIAPSITPDSQPPAA